VAIYETKVYYLSKDFDTIQDKWFASAPGPIEFHAAKIYNHDGEPWNTLGRKNCLLLLNDLCDAISNMTEKGLYLFGVAVHIKSFPRDNPIEKAFYELCGHIDAFISRINIPLGQKEKNRGMIILDSSRYRGHLDQLLMEYRKRGGTKFGRIFNIADAPAFADSKTTRLIQAADLVSYAVFRRYQRGDTSLLDRLISRFDSYDGIIHGLMHQVSRWRDCTCPACMSRNLAEINRSTPESG
jgi:hypothetical protein